MTRHSNKLIGASALSLMLMSGTAALAAVSGTVAFLMPDQGSTRYEQHDFPGFKAEMNKLCPDCKALYQNANGDVSLQQQQFNGGQWLQDARRVSGRLRRAAIRSNRTMTTIS